MSSVRLRVLFLALILAAPLARGAQDVLTPHRVAELCSVSSTVVSPDGKLVAYTLSVPRKAGVEDDGPPWSELHVTDFLSGADRPFITGKVDVSALSWTPDGNSSPYVVQGVLSPNLRPGDGITVAHDRWLLVQFILSSRNPNLSPKLKSFGVTFKCPL